MKTYADFTVDDLFRLSCFDGMKKESRWAMIEEISRRYYEKRDFNFYEQVIKHYFQSDYSLGKTKLFGRGISRDENAEKRSLLRLSNAAKLVDLFIENERLETKRIPDEHAKYFFAFIKEFAQHMATYGLKKEDANLINALAFHFEGLKPIIEKEKNNNDILVILEGVVLNLQNSGLLALKAPEPVMESGGTTLSVSVKKKLDTPLSKLTKAAMISLLNNLEQYDDESYFKIVRSIYIKYGRSEFREKMPILISALLAPDAKMSDFPDKYSKKEEWESAFKFDISDYAGDLRNEEKLNFGPLPAADWDGFLSFLRSWFDKKTADGILSSVDANIVLANEIIELWDKPASDNIKKANINFGLDILLPLIENEIFYLTDNFKSWNDLLVKKIPLSPSFDALFGHPAEKVSAPRTNFYIGPEGSWKFAMSPRRMNTAKSHWDAPVYANIENHEERGAAVLSSLLYVFKPIWDDFVDRANGDFEECPKALSVFMRWCEETLPSFSFAEVSEEAVVSFGRYSFGGRSSFSVSPSSFALKRKIASETLQAGEIDFIVNHEGFRSALSFMHVDGWKYLHLLLRFIDEGKLSLSGLDDAKRYFTSHPGGGVGHQLYYEIASRFDKDMVLFLRNELSLAPNDQLTDEQQIGKYLSMYYGSGYSEGTNNIF